MPIVLANQTIRLECRASIGELDSTLSARVGAAIVPGIRSMCFDTGVELHSGQTLVVRGPVQKRCVPESAKPSASDKGTEKPGQPSDAKQPQEDVELLFLVTPEIVEAAAPGNSPASM